MKIVVNKENKSNKRCGILELKNGDVFEDEDGDLCLRVDDGWITLDAGCVTAYIEKELDNGCPGFNEVTLRPDLRVEINVISE